MQHCVKAPIRGYKSLQARERAGTTPGIAQRKCAACGGAHLGMCTAALSANPARNQFPITKYPVRRQSATIVQWNQARFMHTTTPMKAASPTEEELAQKKEGTQETSNASGQSAQPEAPKAAKPFRWTPPPAPTPIPSAPPAATPTPTPSPSPFSSPFSSGTFVPPPRARFSEPFFKAKRKCGHCRKTGHTRNKCPQLQGNTIQETHNLPQ